ncbi:hypothetical protein M2272_005802 [Mycobacterium frederiksbergense]|uniref:Lipoprotein LpqN n=1 Tax=Mycolicibacterium frederiksbergense TaxID=117567 RepID=A0ABT6L877_9MYCO|nr:hypothetical protein [Mycolicibacterium frederiksbergense]MDH6199134.1 hypothetical protein [Mycolicibacterium frederiksbergense]
MKRVAGVVVLSAGLILSGCTQTTAGTATVGFTPSTSSETSRSPAPRTPAYQARQCEQLRSDRWIEVPGTGPGEPRVRIAQPPNWEPAPDLAKRAVKLVLRNESLSDGVTNPAVTVAAGDATDGDRTPEDLLGDSIKGFESAGGQNIEQVPAEVCGFPALMVNYTLPPSGGGKTIYVTAVTVMVPLGAKVWNLVVMAQSTAPNNKTYMQDAQVMLAGLQIAPPR